MKSKTAYCNIPYQGMSDERNLISITVFNSTSWEAPLNISDPATGTLLVKSVDGIRKVGEFYKPASGGYMFREFTEDEKDEYAEGEADSIMLDIQADPSMYIGVSTITREQWKEAFINMFDTDNILKLVKI